MKILIRESVQCVPCSKAQGLKSALHSDFYLVIVLGP